MKYMESSAKKQQNFPLYSIHFDMDSFILYNSEHDNNEITTVEEKYKAPDSEKKFMSPHGIWILMDM